MRAFIRTLHKNPACGHMRTSLPFRKNSSLLMDGCVSVSLSLMFTRPLWWLAVQASGSVQTRQLSPEPTSDHTKHSFGCDGPLATTEFVRVECSIIIRDMDPAAST